VPSTRPRPVTNHASPGGQDVRWLHAAGVVLSYRAVLTLVPVVCGLIVVAIVLLLPKKYTTTVAFTPVAQEVPAAAALGALAGQFGVNLTGADPSSSPDFYAQLVVTDDLLFQLAQHGYEVREGDGTRRGSFVELYEIDEGDAGKTVAEALRVLRSRIITVSFDRQTSIVSIDVRTKWRDVSLSMATLLLELVNNFNLHTRQTQAGAESKFLAQRMDTARAELRAAEDALQAFLVRNRTYQDAPVLAFQHDRLAREVTLRQQVYTTLMQAYEQARVSAVRNTPSISLVQPPEAALRFDRRHTLPKALGGMVGGFLLAMVYVLVREMITTGRSQTPEDFASFERAWEDTKAGLRRLVPFAARGRANTP